ncbi:hypothetical protein [Streptacidiphilus rugosus]|uniref:hypothetical protein n=1 Tax=Streptacidiphilus rugosus TaxID=405783 RepID=UPI00055A0388|nr:hypothetical protein [Streptacidiphilus rugosus]
MSHIDKDNAPSLTLIRFANLLGALVIVIATEEGHRTSYRWHCTGCLTERLGRELRVNREEANTHAGTCRALPQPEPTT